MLLHVRSVGIPSASDDFGTVRKLTVNMTVDLYVHTSTASFLTVLESSTINYRYGTVQYSMRSIPCVFPAVRK